MKIKFGKSRNAIKPSYDWTSSFIANAITNSQPIFSDINIGSNGYGISVGGAAGSPASSSSGTFNISSHWSDPDEWGTIRCDKIVVDGVKLHDLVKQLVEIVPVFIPPTDTQILDSNPSIKTAYLEYCECKDNLIKARNNLNLLLQIVTDQPNK